MEQLISKVAAFLLASVILSAGCFSCLIPAQPVYAAELATMKVETEQNQNCEKEEKSMMQVTAPSDATMHADHDTNCRHAFGQTSFEVTQFQSPVLYLPTFGEADYFHTHPGHRQASPIPSLTFQKNTILLIGTTIKKE